MDINNINYAIQNENSNYRRNLQRLQQEIANLKTQHQSTLDNLKYQKEMAKEPNKRKNENQDEEQNSITIAELNQNIEKLLKTILC